MDEVLKRLINMLRFHVMHFKGQHNATTTLMHSCVRSTSAKRFSLNGRTCVFAIFVNGLWDGKDYDFSSIRYVKNGFFGVSVSTSRVHSDSGQQLSLCARAMNLGSPVAFACGPDAGKRFVAETTSVHDDTSPLR